MYAFKSRLDRKGVKNVPISKGPAIQAISNGQEIFLKMEPKGYPEMSVRNYNYTLRNDPEKRRSQITRKFKTVQSSPCSVYCNAESSNT
jgi:hypothetical protein